MSLTSAIELYRAGRIVGAETECRRAVSADPRDAEAWYFLGMLLFQSGRCDEAVAPLKQSVALSPGNGEYRNNLAAVLGSLGCHQEALQCAREAVQIDPSSPKAHNNLGVTLERCGRLEEAANCYRRATELDFNLAEPQRHLGNVLRKMGRFKGSALACQRAVELKPTSESYASLAGALVEIGDQDLVIECRRRALAVTPDHATHSDLLLDLLAHPNTTPRMVVDEAKRWAHMYADPLSAQSQPHLNTRRGDRRLRIGYVSADFRNHPVARFIEPVLTAHDRNRFEVCCYSSVIRDDSTTRRLRSLPAAWRDIAKLSDMAAAQLVRGDRIDILIDLSGHTGGNRLLLYARRPAPVQFTYVGYPATTGMSAIDYRLTDEIADPKGAEQFYTEELIRLPRCAWCYEPPATSPEVSPPPVASRGFIAFGALNRQMKVTPAMIHLWAKVLDACPHSRLLVSVSHFDRSDTSVRDRFSQHGLGAQRLDFVERASRDRYLQYYNMIDIALDTFPYNGTATTCDALWMGVPVITLAGNAHVSRTGASLLSSIGLNELVAESESEYIGLALRLANDLNRLREVRTRLRQRIVQSPLVDAANLTREIERAYRSAWEKWCRAS